MFYLQFDKMIESETDEFSDFCSKLNIPVIYTSNEDFISRYLYDSTNPDSVLSDLLRAYDNAVVLRDEIGTETRNLIKTGRSIERIDLYLRLGIGKRELLSEYQKLSGRIDRSGIDYHRLAFVRFAYLLQCEKEDHPETDEEELRRRMISVLETLVDG